MKEQIILRRNPNIEFKIQDDGFLIIDEQTKQNEGFYAFSQLESINLNKPWFPRFSIMLRYFSWILNMGVALFPDAESYKKSNLVIRHNKSVYGIWLTNIEMTKNAKRIKKIIDGKFN